MMTYVQLGWLQDIIDWVFDKILNPVFKWVSDLLTDVFTWVFDNVLGPILETVFTLFAETVGKLIMRILGRYLYMIEKFLLAILDMMQDIFNVLAGTKTVTDTEMGLTGSLLSILVRTPLVTRTLALVTVVSIVLVFFFAVLATIRSIGDMGGPRSQSVGQVLRNLAHALLRMVTAPLLGLVMVLLGDAVLLAITIAMTQGSNATIARSLFVISTLDAVEDEDETVDKNNRVYKEGDNPVPGYNYSTRSAWLADHPGGASDYGLKDIFREPFYTGAKDYMDMDVVEATFNFARMNFLIGIGGTILFIFVIGSSLFVFVSRLFDVIILLIVEPFFLAPMPLDDGEHFRKWEDLFIAKLFSGYGMVVAMYLYLMVCTMVFDGRIAFTAGGDTGDIVMDMLMRILLLLGGAATMMTAGPLVTSLLNSVAAGQEGQALQAGQAFTGTVMKFAAAKTVAGGKQLLGGGDRGIEAPAEKPGGGGPAAAQQFSGVRPSMRPAGSNMGGNQVTAGASPDGNQNLYAAPYAGAGTGDLGAAPPVRGSSDGQQNLYAAPAANESDTSGGFLDGPRGVAMRTDEEDDFETVFDVGGKSLFDEEEPSGAAGTGSAGRRPIDNRPGAAWRIKASPEAVAAVRRKYGIPDRNPDGSIKNEVAKDEFDFDSLFEGSINDDNNNDDDNDDSGKF